MKPEDAIRLLAPSLREAATPQPPHYRDASSNRERCATCDEMEKGQCVLYNVAVAPRKVCDRWAQAPDWNGIPASERTP